MTRVRVQLGLNFQQSARKLPKEQTRCFGEAAEGAEDCPEAKGATREDKAANRAKVQVFMVL